MTESVDNQLDITSDAEVTTIKLLTDFTASSAAQLKVAGNKKLDLNGHVINANGKAMNLFYIHNGAKLTLEDSGSSKAHYYTYNKTEPWVYIGDTYNGDVVDYENMSNATLDSGSTVIKLSGGSITGASGITRGTAVLIDNGTFVMNAGNVVGNKTEDSDSAGGIISLYNSDGTFIMNNGIICGNRTGGCGGGVEITSSGKFYFNGGIISDNYARGNNGSAVQMNGNGAVFNMSGGKIIRNHTGNCGWPFWGSAVLVWTGDFTMTGGEISGNTSDNPKDYAIAVGPNDSKVKTVTIGGDAKITGNTIGGHAANLYLFTNKTIAIASGDDAPTSDMKIGVTMEAGTGNVTNTTDTGQYAQYFSSDNKSYRVFAKDSKVYIGVANVLNVEKETQHATIADALAAASAGDTIRLLGDITENVTVEKNITLDLNGKVLKGTGSGSVVTINNNVTLTLVDSNKTATHTGEFASLPVGGVITGATSGGGVYVKSGATFNMSDGAIYGNKSACGGGVFVDGGTFNMTGGLIKNNSLTDDTQSGAGVFVGKGGSFEMSGGTISGNNGGSWGGGVNINCNCKFKMSDGTISGNSSKNGGGVFVGNGDAEFEMTGGTISGNTATQDGGGVYAGNEKAKLLISGGTISSNTAAQNGGGVYVNNIAGGFMMNGGTISSNTASNGSGGGVYLTGGNTQFTLNGGTISGNKSEKGGGGGVYNDSRFTLSSGTITNNTVGVSGGGVCNNTGHTFIMEGGNISNNNGQYSGGVVNSGTFTMSGGTINGNKATVNVGGVYNSGTFNIIDGTISDNIAETGTGGGVYNEGTFTIDGATKITGNKAGNIANNVYLMSNKIITVATGEAVLSGASVGVTTQTAPTESAPVAITGTNGADYSSYFTSDDPAYSVKNDSNVIKLIKNVSTVTTAPQAKTLLKYDASAQELVTAGVAEHGTMNYAIGTDGTTAPTDASAWGTAIPKGTDAGTYYVWYKSVGDTNYADSTPVCIQVTISKGTHVVTAPTALNPTYNGSEQVLISEGSSTTGIIEYSLDGNIFVAGIGSILATNPGTYTVYYKVEGDANYEPYGPETITAKIVKKAEPTPTPKPDPGPMPDPSPTPDDPVVTPTAPPQGSYAETGLTTKRYVPNGGTTAGIGSVLGTNENQVPLPYVTKESEKAGWTSIDQALKSYKKTKESKTEPFNVTMNGYATVDNQLLSDVNTQKVDLALNLDNDVVVVVPKENKVIKDAINEWNIENALKVASATQLLAGQTSTTPTLISQTQQPKLSDDVYFKVSAITTNDAKANRMTNAGLDMKDIQAIGGDANTPVVKVVTSNASVGLLKSQMIQISFDTTKMTVKYKPGDIVYLYNGSAKAGIGCYTVGTVDKDGKVSFWVPMVSSYWTIGNRNLGSKIMKRK